MPPNDMSTDALLQQAGWLSALARRLVRDPSEADDVTQETLLVALSSETPAHRPWLARVARNIARTRARSQSARAQRESAQTPLPPSPSSAELAEKLEAQRLLVEAVRDLDEPYRSTILLHFWEHKTSEEIAAISGVAAGTVRWRLKQGVDTLRERLDVRHGGDRRAWSAMLVPLVQPSGVGALASPSFLAGILGMKLLMQAAVAAVVLVVVGAGVWWTQRPSVIEATPKLSNERVAVEFKALDERTPAEPQLDAPETAERTTAAAQPAPQRTDIEPVRPARVEARIVDEVTHAIAGARIALMGQRGTPIPPSDALGRVAFDLEPRGLRTERFRITAFGRALRIVSASLDTGKTTYLGDVVLQPGGAVSGRIVDSDHRPVAGASVGLERVDIPQSELAARGEARNAGEPSTQTALDGTFRVDGADVGLCRVIAFSPRHQTGYSGVVEIRAGQESTGVEIELTALSPDRMVRGIVFDPDGAPVPKARVEFHYSHGQSSSTGSFDTDGQGRFEQVVRPGTRVDLTARDARWSDASAMDAQPSDKDIVLRFAPARRVEIAVTSDAGEPIEKWKAHFELVGHEGNASFVDDGKHPGGKKLMQVPALPFVLIVEARGYATAKLGPLDPATVGDRLPVVLRAVPGISGRVTCSEGPLAGAKVRLFAEADSRIEHNGFLVAVDPNAQDTTISGVDGSYLLTPRMNGRWIVRADAERFAPVERIVEGFDAARGAVGIDLLLKKGGTIVGRVLPLPGREAAGTVVSVSRGDAFARTQRVGPDGEFGFEHLMPGRWMVSRRSEELDPYRSSSNWTDGPPAEIPWNCEVIEGQTTRFDLGQDEPARCVLIGKLNVKGSDAGTWNAQLTMGPVKSDPVLLDAGGGFRLERSEPGEEHMVLTAVSGPFDGTRLLVPLTIGIGEARWSTDIDAAKLDLKGPGAGSTAPLVFVVVRDNGSFLLRPLPSAGDVEVIVPAGKGRVLHLDPQSMPGPDPRLWSGGTELTIEAGATVSIERP